MNNTALAVTQTGSVAEIAKQFDYEPNFVETVKNTFAKDATDNELRLFLQTAKRTGLDPFARQIFCIKRWDSSVGGNVMSVQISIDGFRAIADRTERYVPSKEPVYSFDANGQLESATAYIKKFVAGAWHEIAATAFYSEYVQTKKDGNPNSMWQRMPRLMLAKCAESLVLRKAFPAELSGLYTPDEMGTETEVFETEAIRPAGKLQLAEDFRKITEIKTADSDAQFITETEQKMREEIITLSEKLGKSSEQTLNYFNTNPLMREKCLNKVQTAARDVIKTVLASDDWAYSEDGTVEFLKGFGIEGIDAASSEQLAKCLDELRDWGLV